MLENAREDNAVMCWSLRVLGAVLSIAGLRMILAPISLILNFLPLLGGIAETGLSLAAGLAGFAWSLIVVALAWVRYRPLLAGAMLAFAAALAALAYVFVRRRKAQAPVQFQPAAPAVPGQPGRQFAPQQPQPPSGWQAPQGPYGQPPMGGNGQQGWHPGVPGSGQWPRRQ